MSSNDLWAGLIELNKRADALIERVRRAVEPSQPISREIPFSASIEVRFDNLPDELTDTVGPNSEALEGLNIKRGTFTNGSSRVYVREMTFTPYRIGTVTPLTANVAYEARIPAEFEQNYPFNWAWNFWTSITQRHYAVGKGGAGVHVMAQSAGRYNSGSHIAFREPLIIEPMETLTLEVELLAFGIIISESAALEAFESACISLSMSGYREGI